MLGSVNWRYFFRWKLCVMLFLFTLAYGLRYIVCQTKSTFSDRRAIPSRLTKVMQLFLCVIFITVISFVKSQTLGCTIQCPNGMVPGECKCKTGALFSPLFPNSPFSSSFFQNTDPCANVRCKRQYQQCRSIGGRGLCVLAGVSLFPSLNSWSNRQTHYNSPTAVDKCSLPLDSGVCDGYMKKGFNTRYYFDSQTKRCKRFIYGGCGQNGNNFRTLRECLNECAHV